MSFLFQGAMRDKDNISIVELFGPLLARLYAIRSFTIRDSYESIKKNFPQILIDCFVLDPEAVINKAKSILVLVNQLKNDLESIKTEYIKIYNEEEKRLKGNDNIFDAREYYYPQLNHYETIDMITNNLENEIETYSNELNELIQSPELNENRSEQIISKEKLAINLSSEELASFLKLLKEANILQDNTNTVISQAATQSLSTNNKTTFKADWVRNNMSAKNYDESLITRLLIKMEKSHKRIIKEKKDK